MKAELEVFLSNEHVGTIIQMPDTRVIFSFQQDYVLNKLRPTLSQSFLSSDASLLEPTRIYRGKVPPFFSNLLPEGHLRKYLAQKANIGLNEEFKLLGLLGGDLPGAVVVVPSHDEYQNLKKKHSKTPKNDDSSTLLRFSLAGVQLKLSALMGRDGGLTIPASGLGGDWIVKLPSSSFQHVPENEYSMMTLASMVGISTPDAQLIPISNISGLPEFGNLLGDYAFAVRRFDRGKDGLRIHMEDFAQVYGVFPDKKYEGVGYSGLAQMVWTLTGEIGLREFIQRLVFCIMTGNGDMHLKNWSFLYKDKIHPNVSPAYDLVSTIPYIHGDGLALKLVGTKEMTRCNLTLFEKMAHKAEVPKKIILDTVKETAEKTRSFWDKEKKNFPLPESIMLKIDNHMKEIPL